MSSVSKGVQARCNSNKVPEFLELHKLNQDLCERTNVHELLSYLEDPGGEFALLGIKMY